MLKSFPESTKKTAVVLVDETNALFKDWVLKKVRRNHERAGVLCLVMASSTTGSLEGALRLHRHWHFVAFERAASRRLQHGRFGLPRWLMDNGFAGREERHVHGVQLQIRGARKGRVRGHMMWLTRTSPGSSSSASFSTSASSRMLVHVLRPQLVRCDEMNMLLVRCPTCLAVQTLEGLDKVSETFGCFPEVCVVSSGCFSCLLGSRGLNHTASAQNLPIG